MYVVAVGVLVSVRIVGFPLCHGLDTDTFTFFVTGC